MELLEVILLTVDDKRRQSDTGKIAYSNLIRARVLDNFSAQVTALDGAEVLLVRLAIASVLVKHVWGSRFSLRFQDGKPELLSLDGLAATSFTFITFIESLENQTTYLESTHKTYYSSYAMLTSNSSPQTSCKLGASLGQNKVQSPLASTRFMNKSGIQRA